MKSEKTDWKLLLAEGCLPISEPQDRFKGKQLPASHSEQFPKSMGSCECLFAFICSSQEPAVETLKYQEKWKVLATGSSGFGASLPFFVPDTLAGGKPETGPVGSPFLLLTLSSQQLLREGTGHKLGTNWAQQGLGTTGTGHSSPSSASPLGLLAGCPRLPQYS